MEKPEYSVINSHITDINSRIPTPDKTTYAGDLRQAGLVSQAGYENALAAMGTGPASQIASLTAEAMGKIKAKPHLFNALVNIIEERSEDIAFASMLRKEYQDKKQGVTGAGVTGVTSGGATGATGVPVQGQLATTGDTAETPLFELTPDFKRKNKPLTPPSEESKIEAVKQFATNVKVVIQTCNRPEYFAALEKLKPPNKEFAKPVEYRHSDKLTIVVGTFADIDAAIIKTEQGAKCISELKSVFEDVCTNATWLLGLGVCYGLKKKRDLKFADVLVGKKIEVIEAPKFNDDGTMDTRGEVKTTHRLVQKMFCEDEDTWEDFVVCEKPSKRIAKASVGLLASASILINDPKVIQGLEKSSVEYLGGEMEGGVQIMHTPERVKCIIIKGISDFANGTKDKVWQLTAAKAAVSYAHSKLEENKGFL